MIRPRRGLEERRHSCRWFRLPGSSRSRDERGRNDRCYTAFKPRRQECHRSSPSHISRFEMDHGRVFRAVFSRANATFGRFAGLFSTVRILTLAASVLSLVIFTGCDSMPTRVAERFATVEPQEREFEKERAVVFQAIPEALKRMRFVTARALEAQGVITGRSTIRTEDAFREAHQYEFDIKLREFGEGVTKVSVLLHEQNEGDFKAGASSQALRSHGLYDSFFDVLAQVLAEPAVTPVAGTP